MRSSTRRRTIVTAACVLAALVLFAAVSVADEFRRAVFRLPTSEKVVALTFDDGPDPRFTQSVLDILNAEGVPGTFFLVGSKVEADAGATDYAGHLVGYHSYDHTGSFGLSSAEQIAEFERGGACLSDACDLGSGYYRCPGGKAWPATVRWADRNGTYLAWSITYDEFIGHGPPDRVYRITGHPARVKGFVDAVRPGDIVLMHDGNDDGKYLVEDLPDIIRELKAQGYRFVTPEEYAKQF